MTDAVFIYRKEINGNTNFRVTSLDSPSFLNEELLKAGWKHIATLKASLWLEVLFNSPPEDSNDIIEELLFKNKDEG